ncbi:MAG: Mrp/NBP35 family ATP-binding protein [Acidimicrobiales bacterium]
MAALSAVRDPVLGRGLVELGLVRSVRARWGKVSVTVARASPGYPRSDELRRLVEEALRGLSGVKDVEVSLIDLVDSEAMTLAGILRSGAGGGIAGTSYPAPTSDAHTGPAHGGSAPLGHEEGKANAFMRPGSRTRVLGISSGKGGVGKSSVTVNLAVALSARGHDVAILDADVYGFSIPRMLGLDESPMLVGDLVIPPVAHGVRCLSTGFFVADETPVIWRGPMLHKALEQFLVDTHWGDPDFLLIDMPPGTGDVALSLSQYLPRSEVVVVTTPQAAAQRVAQRSAHMAKRLKLPVRGVIENMSWFTGDEGHRYEIFGSGGGKALAGLLSVPLLGQIPLVPALRVGGDDGLPVTVSDPTGEAASAFAALAERVEGIGPARVYRRELTIRS